MRIALLFMCSFFYTCLALAHPPAKIDAAVTESTLAVIVTHIVPDPEIHYVNEITVTLNGKRIITQIFLLQTGNIQEAAYNIPGLKKGDALEIEANCNQYGDLGYKTTVQ